MKDSMNPETSGKNRAERPAAKNTVSGTPSRSASSAGTRTGQGAGVSRTSSGSGSARTGTSGSSARTAGSTRSTGTSPRTPGTSRAGNTEPMSLKERSRKNRKKTTWEKLVEIVKLLWKNYRLQTIAVLILLVLILICCLVKCSTGGKDTPATPTPGQAETETETGTETAGPLTETPTETDEQVSTVSGDELVPTDLVFGDCESVTSDPDVVCEDVDGWKVDKLMLVNWSHKLKYSGDPEDLVNMTDYMTDSRYIFVDPSTAKGNREAVIALNQMCVDAMDAGCSNVKFSATGTYRTYETQDGFWQNHLEEDSNYGADPYNNPTRTVPANVSEHRTGLGFDIWLVDYDYDWLHENSYKYGFILRYPSDKRSITGIIYEQWHFRYVGVEAATEMYELGFCLEEYIAYKNGADITPNPTKAATAVPTKSAATRTPTPTAAAAADTVTVPDLTNKTESEAAALLQSLGLEYSLGEGEFNDAIKAGYIYYQSIKAGTEVEKGTLIELDSSLGPVPKDDATPTPTPTPTEAPAEDTPTPTPTEAPAEDTPTPTPTEAPAEPDEPSDTESDTPSDEG